MNDKKSEIAEISTFPDLTSKLYPVVSSILTGKRKMDIFCDHESLSTKYTPNFTNDIIY